MVNDNFDDFPSLKPAISISQSVGRPHRCIKLDIKNLRKVIHRQKHKAYPSLAQNKHAVIKQLEKCSSDNDPMGLFG